MMFRKKVNSGFTLVELLVTISIFVILTGVVIFNQSKFNSTILLTNLAYDTALTIRQAQSYGINVKSFNNLKGIAYGVHFDTTNDKSFILFADLDNNGIYKGETDSCSITDPNSNEGDLCINRYSIKRGNFLKDICSEDQPTSNPSCSTSADTLDIVFKRPNPDAYITVDENNTDKPYAKIILGSPDTNSNRIVRVGRNGLIEIIN